MLMSSGFESANGGGASDIPNMGDQVWLMTSRQTLPLLRSVRRRHYSGLCLQFIDVRVEDLVHEPDAGRLVGELLWQLDMDLPDAVRKRCCVASVIGLVGIIGSLGGAIEAPGPLTEASGG